MGKNSFISFISVVICLSLIGFSCLNSMKTPVVTDETQIAGEMEELLVKNIFDVWYPKTIDTLHGGFFTNFNKRWEKKPQQEKFIITQARSTWTACKAAELYPNHLIYRKAADQGYVFLRDYMWDKKNGGFISCIDCKTGDKLWIDMKHAYGNAFAIYALSAYAKLTGSEEALNLAKQTFQWLEKYSHDQVYGGYFNFLTNQGISFASDDQEKGGFPSYLAEVRYKDYNSSIHILEAFAALYKLWPDSVLKDRLNEMLAIIRDTMVSPEGFLMLYFERNWNHISYSDSSEEEQKTNVFLDHISFGHDIETAYLLLETSEALGLKHDTLTMKVAKKLIDHTVKEGFDRNYYGLFDAGYYRKKTNSIIIINKEKIWWSQAEALNGLLLFSKLFPSETKYKDAFINLWDYIKKNLVDYKYGDWYLSGLDSDPGAKRMPKASDWKCNYHTSRALMNCSDYIKGKSELLNHYVNIQKN